MIHLLWPSSDKGKPKDPITLEVGEIQDYGFGDSADQIYSILSILQLCDLVEKVPYRSSEEVLEMIQNLIDDIDLGSDELQISESKHIRVEFRDDMLALEVYVGV